MGADNGIYILQTNGPEFRVSELQAIENVYWDDEKESDDPDVWIKNAREMWAYASVFTDEGEALKEAMRHLESMCICEYGISKIKIPRRFT